MIIPPEAAATFSIVTFNVHDLFDLVREPGKRDRRSTPSPYQFEVKLQKLMLAVRDELACPEIVVVQEIDNEGVLQALGDRINESAGTRYRATSLPTSDVRGIEVGFLFDERRAELEDSYQLYGIEVERAFGRTSPKPGREPLVGVFHLDAIEITIVGVHFKSRGGPQLLAPAGGSTRSTVDELRREQALAVRRFVDEVLDRDPKALLAVAGDFNDYRYEPFEEADHPISIVEGLPGRPMLRDVVESVPEEHRYTFSHHGAKHPLDHILASPALAERIAEVEIAHFNADFPRALMSDYESANRSSDHDPVVMRLRR